MDSASAGGKNLEENAAASSSSSLDIWKNRIIIPTLVAGFNSIFFISVITGINFDPYDVIF